MIILTDENNLIVSFATSGGFEGGIDIDESILPSTFVAEFKSGKFKYEDNNISYNRNFIDDEANAQLRNENSSLEDKVVTLENRIVELENIIYETNQPSE